MIAVSEYGHGFLAQRGFAAGLVAAFVAPWGRPSLLVVCLRQGRRRKPIVCPTLAKNRRGARRSGLCGFGS